MKLTGVPANLEELREYFAQLQEEDNALVRRRSYSEKTNQATISLIDPIAMATMQAKSKLRRKRTAKKRKGSGQPIRRTRTKKQTNGKRKSKAPKKKSKAGARSRSSQSKSSRRKDNFSR